MATAMGAPALALASLQEHNTTSCETPRIVACHPFPEALAGPLVLVRFVAYYALPLGVVGLFYSLMAARLRRGLPGEGLQRRVRDRRRRAAHTLVAFVAVFFVCFLPQHVFLLWFRWHPTALDDYDDTWHGIRIVGFCLSFANSCANPVALYCVSGTFRRLFNRHLPCWCHRRALGVVGRGASTSTPQVVEPSVKTTVFNHV